MSNSNPNQVPPTQGGLINQNELREWQDRAKNAFDAKAWSTASPQDARPWANGLWECFSPPSLCCMTWCCSCVTFGKTHHRLRNNGDMKGYEPLNTSCILFYFSSYFCLTPVLQALQLQEIRETHNLEGSCAKDLVCSFCCLGCSLCQAEKESKQRAPGGKAGVEVDGYKSERMVMPGSQQ